MTLFAAAATALALGTWTALQPCPMAANLAAISYLGRRTDRPAKVLWAGLLYALGQATAYVALAIIVIGGLVSTWRLSTFLQENITLTLGPIWILTGMLLLDLIHLPLRGSTIGSKWQDRIAVWGIWSAFPLGVALALAFCPASATCFFVSLMAIAATSPSRIVLPAIYGLGAALPAVICALLIAFGARVAGKVWHLSDQIQRGIRRVGGVLLLLMGIHYSIQFNFDVTPFWDPWVGALQSVWTNIISRFG
jgi:cytochrome c-type biogenesis protein